MRYYHNRYSGSFIIKNLIKHKFKRNYRLKSSPLSSFVRNEIIKLKKIFLISILIILFAYIYKYINIIKIKVCLCVIAKNENKYAREFVEHYLNIGYNKIYIYDNNDKNGENFREVINDYIKKNLVQIINYREKEDISEPQFDAYRECYHKNNKYYDWLSFFDMDEFLEINKKYYKIQNFLSEDIFNNCQNIKINWLICINDHILYSDNKPLQKRNNSFRSTYPLNIHIKSTVRGNLPINYWRVTWNPHSSLMNFTSCSSSGKIVKYTSPYIKPPDYTNAILKHYYYKSFEEYCIKIKRGFADRRRKTKYLLIENNYKTLKNKYKNNIQKYKIIKKIFNDSY